MPTVEVPARTFVYGWACWFCARRFATKGEKPTHWRETTCAALGRGECEVESQFWSGRSRRKAALEGPNGD